MPNGIYHPYVERNCNCSSENKANGNIFNRTCFHLIPYHMFYPVATDLLHQSIDDNNFLGLRDILNRFRWQVVVCKSSSMENGVSFLASLALQCFNPPHQMNFRILQLIGNGWGQNLSFIEF